MDRLELPLQRMPAEETLSPFRAMSHSMYFSLAALSSMACQSVESTVTSTRMSEDESK